MRRESPIWDLITSVASWLLVAYWISEIFKIGFWLALGVHLCIAGSLVALVFGLDKIRQALARRKRCTHGIKRGKEGGCQFCVAEEEKRQAKWKAYQAAEQHRKEIKEVADALRASELSALRKRWLARAELYLQMAPRQFENAIAELFRNLGYEVRQTPYSNDRGKDAIALKDDKKFLIECKRYDAMNTIGRRELQIFVAAMKEENAQGGFYINTSRFASTAAEYAKQNQIELYDRTRLPSLVNLAYPVKEDVSSAIVLCLECGDVQRLPVASAPTSGTCANGHQITNDITTGLILGASFAPETMCDRCGSEMRLVGGRYRKFWGCSRYPKCRFRRRYRGDALQPGQQALGSLGSPRAP
ncbi:MAG: restriction endonuclease [Candidatus Sulfotelmatobacter sp.]